MPLPSLAYALGGLLTLLISLWRSGRSELTTATPFYRRPLLVSMQMAIHRLLAIESGFQEHVVKPVERAILAETLAHLVRRADHIGH
jgi:hypothetical protein